MVNLSVVAFANTSADVVCLCSSNERAKVGNINWVRHPIDATELGG